MTLSELIAYYWGSPDFARAHPLPIPLDGRVRALGKLGASTGTFLLRAAEAPPSSGYKPWLVENGFSPVVARMMADLIVRRGRRVAVEMARQTEVAKALRFLAGHYRGRSAIARRIRVLLAAWEETSAFDTIFEGSGLDVFVFIALLKAAALSPNEALPQLREIAAELSLHLSIPCGPKVSAASAAHEFFLEDIVPSIGRSSAYTWSDLEEDFTDSLTEATRREFNEPDFDPRSAYRRIKARQSKG